MKKLRRGLYHLASYSAVWLTPESSEACPTKHDEAGFTLVEVLAAFAILACLGLCIINLWAVCNQTTFELLQRQKAVLVLNGEMERLAALYENTPFGGSPITSTSGYPLLTNVPGSDTRLTYAANSIGFGSRVIPFAYSSTSAFSAGPDTGVWIGGGSPAQDFVWIDHGRNLMGRLSWATCPVSSNSQTSNLCWTTPAGGKAPPYVASACMLFASPAASGSTPCLLVTMILDYPYRLTNGAAVQAATTLSTLTLSTIVGRRS
ncbi:MAG: type IV pilus modification PilV family protein [Janthinobacterium lividum]